MQDARLDYTDTYIASTRPLLEAAINGVADAKDVFLDSMTKYFVARMDEEDERIRLTEDINEISNRAEKLRVELMSQICQNQRGLLVSLEAETGLCENRVGDALFFAGLREGLMFRQMIDGFIKGGRRNARRSETH
jgi:hypothetical protein